MASPQQTALMTESVSNLIGGVSQQADSARQPTQATEILNALLSPTEGLKKRPPSKLLQDLTDAFSSLLDTSPVLDPGCVFTHMYNRDSDEKYVVLVVDGDLRVFSLIDGTEKTVSFPDGKDYLVADNPGEDFKAITVGDYTFLVNTTIAVDQLSTLSPAVVFEALVWVRQGDYGVDYSVILDGTTYRISTDLSHKDEVTSEYIAGALFAKIPSGKGTGVFTLGAATYAIGNTITVTRTSTGGGSVVYTVKAGPDGLVESLHDMTRGITDLLNQHTLATSGHIFAYPVGSDDSLALTDGFAISNITSGEVYTWSITTTGLPSPNAVNTSQANTYTLVRNGSTLYIKKVSGADFTISTHDGLGDQAIRAIKGQIQRFADLPARAVDGFRIEITGESRSLTDNFYVIYQDDEAATTDGVWKESLKGGEKISLDPDTMPWLLVRESDGTFTFQSGTWDSRLVGDLDNAPFPSFYGKTISNVFFFKNRLGLVAEENIILSSVGNYYNFFRLSIQQLLDEDIIDFAVAATEVAFIRHTTPHESDMTLWADREQFICSGKPILTAKTITCPPVTAFESSARVQPTRVGKDILFTASRGSSTKVMEFFKTPLSDSSDAEDITSLVQSYCAGEPLQITGSENIGMAALATLSNTNDVYIYNFVWLGNQLAQSAWSTWKFGNSGNVLAIQFIQNKLVLIIQRDTSVLLEVIEILPDDTDSFSVHLTYLDCRMSDETAGVSSVYAGGLTTWTLPIDIPEDTQYPLKVCLRATEDDDPTTELDDITRPADNQIACTGDHTGDAVWIGLSYDYQVSLSKLYIREQAQDGRVSAITDAVTQLRNLELKYDKSGYFKVDVTPTGRSVAYTTEMDDDTNEGDGTLKVPIMANNEKVSIVVTNSSHRPCAIQGMAWDALVSQLTRR